MTRYVDELDSVIAALATVREHSLALTDRDPESQMLLMLPARDLDQVLLLLERAREQRERFRVRWWRTSLLSLVVSTLALLTTLALTSARLLAWVRSA